MSNAYANRNGGRPVWDASPAPPLSSYDALRDPNMRHYFENRSVQAHLYKTGQIDAAGRVIDMSKNASKFAIIEQEFKAAEKLGIDFGKTKVRRMMGSGEWCFGVVVRRSFPFYIVQFGSEETGFTAAQLRGTLVCEVKEKRDRLRRRMPYVKRDRRVSARAGAEGRARRVPRRRAARRRLAGRSGRALPDHRRRRLRDERRR